MTVHVVVPVFNRLTMTQALVACLRRQVLQQPLHILIIDDGSSDGTAEWLESQCDIEVLKGDGSLYWGGSVDLALRHLQNCANPQDWVLLMNNDTIVKNDFIQRLLDTALIHAPAAVGSVICDKSDPTRLLSIGARVDAWRLLVSDLLEKVGRQGISSQVIEVDALSGRGVMYPMAGLIATGGMRPRALPHYLADYELSLRLRKKGWRLLVSTEAVVYSNDDFGSSPRAPCLRNKWFSIRSPHYLPAQFLFWWGASSWLQRLTLPLRLFCFTLFPRMRKQQV